MEKKPIFLSGLNGIRTIAACGVLFSHVNLTLGKFGLGTFSLFGFSKEGKANSWVLGEHGVTMFFVLSGFLITYLLLKELEKSNKIDIRKFYIRRILRIWPLYFFYLLITFILLRDSIHLDHNMLYYLTFLANIPFILKQGYPGMEHLWSISIEEQFYLFWPFMFLLFVKGRFLKKIVFFILLLSVFRIFIWSVSPFSILAFFSVVNRFDCMALGALGAYMVHRQHRIVSLINLKYIQYIAWIVLSLLVLNRFHFFNSIIEIFIVEAITLIIIIGQINVKNRIVNLENTLFSYIGKLSFGLYVYHPLIIILTHKYIAFNFFNSIYINVICVFLFVFVITLVVSHISYFYFESRFLNLKHKYSVVDSSNSKI
jgi:peptidoglycan/LPS O-acetylase OafA/YrhL